MYNRVRNDSSYIFPTKAAVGSIDSDLHSPQYETLVVAVVVSQVHWQLELELQQVGSDS